MLGRPRGDGAADRALYGELPARVAAGFSPGHAGPAARWGPPMMSDLRCVRLPAPTGTAEVRTRMGRSATCCSSTDGRAHFRSAQGKSLEQHYLEATAATKR